MAEITVTRPSGHAIEELGILQWPIWTCGVSKFEWHYDQKETCYILEGDVRVKGDNQEVSFGPGDLVVFPEGLDTVWDVREPVKKHYKMG